MDREKELEEGLIGLMRALGISMYRAIFCLAEIRAHHLHEEMVRWIASYYGMDKEMTAGDFMRKLGELAENGDERL
jgi:hypothetical protein